ncbi:hypothetical protein V3C33_19490 [Micrococcaceae bacterium Sec5.7]
MGAAPQHFSKVFTRLPVDYVLMNRTGPSAAFKRWAWALTVALCFATALGGWRAAATIAGPPDPSTLAVNGASYSVTRAEQVKGLSDTDLAGMSHGIQSLVTDDQALINLHVVVAAGDSPASYDASVLRVFAVGSPKGYPPVGGIIAPGRLRPHSRVEGFLSFVVPRDGARIVLRAPGNSDDVPLLEVDVAPAGAGGHMHPSSHSP